MGENLGGLNLNIFNKFFHGLAYQNESGGKDVGLAYQNVSVGKYVVLAYQNESGWKDDSGDSVDANSSFSSFLHNFFCI